MAKAALAVFAALFCASDGHPVCDARMQPRAHVQTSRALPSLALHLRGGSSAVDSAAPSTAWRKGVGGWQGAQRYFETTGINITATAGSIAAYRSAVTLCNNTYLDDPFAALFARETCPERFNEILSLPPPKLARFAVRTKFFDNFIRDGIHRRGIKQVVLIGAGFDARALRGADMRWDTLKVPTAMDMMESNVLCFYELDLPEIISHKRHLLERSGMGSSAAAKLGLPKTHRIAVDVMSEDWVALIHRYGFRKEKPTLWLLEGFLYYFDQPDVNRILATLSAVSAPGSRVGMSAVSAAAAAPASKTSKFKWGIDFPDALLEQFGWDEAVTYQLGCPDIAEGWDMSDVCPSGAPEPRQNANVKRTWYVTATFPGEPVTDNRERLVRWLQKKWTQAKPWAELLGRYALQFATSGVQVKLPIPPWLADIIRK